MVSANRGVRRTGGGATAVTRRHFVRASSLMAAGILSACALGGADGGAPRGPKGPVKISYMTDWAGGQRLKTVEDALGLWKQKYPNITVDFHPTNEIHAKIVTDIAAGTQEAP